MAALIECLVERGHVIDVYLPGSGSLCGLLTAAGVAADGIVRSPAHRWISPRGRGPAGAIRLAQCLADVPIVARKLRARRPDVLVINTSVIPAPMLAGRLLRIPTVVIVREAVRTNPVMASALPKDLLVAAMRSWVDRVVAVSEFAGAQVGADEVILEHVRSRPLPQRRHDDGPLRVVVVGAVTSDKGQLDAVRSIEISLAAGADVQLDIYGAGSGNDIRRLTETINASPACNCVMYHGEIDDIRAVFAGSDLVLVPSRNEGFGRVTVEALQAGVPVVGYDCGGTAEVLRHGGGALVAPDANAMAAALIELASDPAKLARLGVEARTVGARWSASTTDEDLAVALERLALSGRSA